MITTLRASPLSLATTSKVISISTFYFPPYRRYHSYQHPSPPSPFTPAESAILSAALRRVPSHGFSATALSLGARDVGYPDISINLFPRGVYDLVNYHLVTERLRLSQNIDSKGITKNLGTLEKIRTLCVERLRANSPIINQWQEAMSIMSLGENISASVAELAKLSDEIWFLSGDGSHDMGWYTKRAMLSGVYASTELFMTQDTSMNFEETWKFLDRRLNDVKLLGNSFSNISSYIDYTAHAFSNVLRSKSFPLL